MLKEDFKETISSSSISYNDEIYNIFKSISLVLNDIENDDNVYILVPNEQFVKSENINFIKIAIQLTDNTDILHLINLDKIDNDVIYYTVKLNKSNYNYFLYGYVFLYELTYVDFYINDLLKSKIHTNIDFTQGELTDNELHNNYILTFTIENLETNKSLHNIEEFCKFKTYHILKEMYIKSYDLSQNLNNRYSTFSKTYTYYINDKKKDVVLNYFQNIFNKNKLSNTPFFVNQITSDTNQKLAYNLYKNYLDSIKK